jgi:hypothetical protein
MAVVVAHEVGDGAAQLGIAGEALVVDDLGLERVPERLHERVVGELARPVHALHDAERSEPGAIGLGGVFGATIGVEHEAGRRATAQQGAVKGGQRQGEVALGGEGPAEHATRVPIHDRGEVAPAGTEADPGDVADPDRVRCARGRSRQAVRDRGEVHSRAAGAPIEAGRAGAQPSLPHQPRDTLAAVTASSLGQRRVDARCAIGAGTRRKDRADPFADADVRARMVTRPPAPPGIEAGAGHAVAPAQGG